MAVHHSGSQSVILELAGLESPGNLPEMQILFGPTESETLGVIEPRIQVLTSPSGDSDTSLRSTDQEDKIQTA